MAKKYTEKYVIPSYECDRSDYLKIPTLVKILIQISGNQSKSLGVSDAYVHTFGLGWIILQHDISIKRLPVAGETVTLGTEAANYNKFFCYRNFWILDEEGNECVTMETTFALMDLKERKMGSVLDEIIAPFESEKIKRIKRGEKVLPVEEITQSKEYSVRYYDIDDNQHVNNAIYLDWMIDVLEIDWLTEKRPSSVSIKFNKEIRYGEVVTSSYQQDEDNTSRHQVTVGEDICAEANITWHS
ncbi:acyl-[acyl-carrier-protein] thioesterase [Vagococcus hydrophili]|uniref:Acyl-[acyl-carrier-protein] thioesterase n=1 Tax=Vagococcus hydrophili TaxID=2714947 RepID=A0A6G8AR09_9ENTE|nr:acyl-ACP thioesterase domain-containing protein [Vagococcus hydrophili]QIL47518.1 acyl-[acyl-carrier-protein] thioesterase [Vagococcus hydrophili]